MRQCLVIILLLVLPAAGCVVELTSGGNTQNQSKADDTSAAKAGGKLHAYMEGVTRGLAPEVQEALKGVEGDSRRLLAIRGYLRGGRDLGTKWAWSQEQIDSYKQSAEYAAAVAEIEKVRMKFAELNPGYSLHVNTEVRSLSEQVRNWNEADSVRRAGDELALAASKELSDEKYKPTPDEAGLRSFEVFLRGHRPSESPTVAVPGLSAHGQLRAFDFQVKRGEELIAGTSSAGVRREWDEAGWAGKLSEAVGKASTKFTGPLESPYEPWHYTYTP